MAIRLPLLAVMGALMIGGPSFAADHEDDDSFFGSTARFPASKERSSQYGGARDEQALEIQGVLPQPTRSADGSVPASSDEDEPQETAPDTD